MAVKKTAKGSRSGKGNRGKKAEIKKGSQYVCADCGIVLTVDEVCGCPSYHEIVCCGEPMAVRECY